MTEPSKSGSQRAEPGDRVPDLADVVLRVREAAEMAGGLSWHADDVCELVDGGRSLAICTTSGIPLIRHEAQWMPSTATLMHVLTCDPRTVLDMCDALDAERARADALQAKANKIGCSSCGHEEDRGEDGWQARVAEHMLARYRFVYADGTRKAAEVPWPTAYVNTTELDDMQPAQFGRPIRLRRRLFRRVRLRQSYGKDPLLVEPDETWFEYHEVVTE